MSMMCPPHSVKIVSIPSARRALATRCPPDTSSSPLARSCLLDARVSVIGPPGVRYTTVPALLPAQGGDRPPAPPSAPGVSGSRPSPWLPPPTGGRAAAEPGEEGEHPRRNGLVRVPGPPSFPFSPVLHELPAEAPLDAQMPTGDVPFERRGDLHDVPVLHVQGEGAPHPAVGADRVGGGMAFLVPLPPLPHVVLGLEHERARRAHAYAVAAVDTGRSRKRHVELRGDAGLEAPAGHRDGKGVLSVHPASLDALVAEDAAAVVPDVEVIVDLRSEERRVGKECRGGTVVTSVGPVPLARRGR